MNVANGKTIPEDIKQAMLEVANRGKDTLEKAIDNWNSIVERGLDSNIPVRKLSTEVLCDSIALSYGSAFARPEVRKALILWAVESTGRSLNFSRN